jgi:hypothetical protein
MKHKERYGQWSGNPKGRNADLTKCAEEVWSGFLSHQCTRKCGYGEDGVFCKQHAKQIDRSET